MSCLECGERRRLWGAYCGPCFREVNCGVKVEAPPPLVLAPEPPLVLAPTPPPKPPRPPAKPRKVAATKLPPPPKVARGCSWPGCDRKHGLHGCCRRHAHRLGLMGAVGTDPATWAALWEAHLVTSAANIDAARRSRKGKHYAPRGQAPHTLELAARLRALLTDTPQRAGDIAAALGVAEHVLWRAFRRVGARCVGAPKPSAWVRG